VPHPATVNRMEDVTPQRTALPEASPADLPLVLAEPPWAEPSRRPVVLLAAPPIERVALTEAEHAALVGGGEPPDPRAWTTDPAPKNGSASTFLLATAPIELARRHFAQWNGDCIEPTVWEFGLILGRFGTAAFAPVLRIVRRYKENTQAALLWMVSPEAARTAAEWLVTDERTRSTAETWLDRHPEDAAALLIPDALDVQGKRRRHAEAALIHLAGVRGPGFIAAAAAEYGSEAATAVEALIAIGPLIPATDVPDLGAWVDPARLPQVLLADRARALPAEAVRHLVTVLALSGSRHPYAGLGIVADTCDRESLRRFSIALFERWSAFGAPPEDDWALTQLVHFAGDEGVRSLADRMGRWPGEYRLHLDRIGLEALESIGSDAALAAVHSTGQASTSTEIRKAAVDRAEAIAAARGLTPEQVADRLVPDLGFDGDLLFVAGTGVFTMSLDERLRVAVTDEWGRPHDGLPRGGDDEDDAEHRRFVTLKRDLHNVVTGQTKRLEAAMLSGRTWTPKEFERFILGDAVLRRLAQRLVWTSEDGGHRTSFRIAEDRTFADVDDDSIALPETAAISLAHPALLGPEAVAAWSALIGDYGILQPFDQLARPVSAFTAAELATGRVSRFDGIEVGERTLLALEAKGWKRAERDGGLRPGMIYGLPGGDCVLLRFDKGIGLRLRDEPQQFEVRLSTGVPTDWAAQWDHGYERPNDIDPVAASEVLRTLNRLVGR
jgi:hypothetical protein